MNTRRLNFILAGVIILLLAVGLFFVLKGQSKQSEATVDSPCADTIYIQKDLSKICAKIDSSEIAIRALIAEKNHLQKALNAAIKRCRPNLSSGDTLVVKVVPDVPEKSEQKETPVKPRIKNTKQSNSSVSESSGQQNVSSEYRAPAAKSVSTSVTGGNTPKALFCINLRDMDGSSFWPALAIDAGQTVENAVRNGTADGWNISIYPVTEVSGLYGVTTDGRMFVKAELVDQFGPTVIKMSGSPNGWKTWVEAQLETVNGENYYITP